MSLRLLSRRRGGNENLQTGATEAASQHVPLPARILPTLRVRQVAAGAMHSLALTDCGDIWGWGQPLTSFGSSVDTNLYARQRMPCRVEGAANVVRIAAGAFHNLALTATGHVLAWGNSDYGQLGLGTTTHVASPHVVCHACLCMQFYARSDCLSAVTLRTDRGAI